ncbi:methyltransferase, TIGR04325 family [Microseira wollei]|uniref:Methyltransferase, TIGR04325 family n=1 Tax=Microseira wollei NIES-4236 TaxID=2530354 RepID=A0AAV3X613_9CYAN|nr:methyltransferase, TIGR04325 family [Microseira wollei]GET35774.1 hypothetical protein MiSe_05200 [Microseira wollei NIES-4236]
MEPTQLMRSLYWYLRFPGAYGSYRGIFATTEQAIASAPKNRKIGYNHADLAKEYQSNFYKAIGSYDYPILFWLKDLLQEGSTVFDFGGNMGNHFYGYEKYIKYPQNFKWIVCELPEIIKAGEEIAAQEKRTEIVFTSQFEEAEKANILMASGSIQYLGPNFAQLLSKLNRKPNHLLLSRLPLCEGKSFVTLQNGGLVFYPVNVMNRDEFIESICGLGYKLIDSWKDRAEPCSVPFHPEFTSLVFNGLYLKLS